MQSPNALDTEAQNVNEIPIQLFDRCLESYIDGVRCGIRVTITFVTFTLICRGIISLALVFSTIITKTNRPN